MPAQSANYQVPVKPGLRVCAFTYFLQLNSISFFICLSRFREAWVWGFLYFVFSLKIYFFSSSTYFLSCAYSPTLKFLISLAIAIHRRFSAELRQISIPFNIINICVESSLFISVGFDMVLVAVAAAITLETCSHSFGSTTLSAIAFALALMVLQVFWCMPLQKRIVRLDCNAVKYNQWRWKKWTEVAIICGLL